MMEVLRTIDGMRRWNRQSTGTIGLVPTMGALHEGHLSLVRASVKKADRTVVSVFVNPLQFGANEDLSAYPRTFEQDLALLKAAGADAVFYPSVEEMYPRGESLTRVSVGTMGQVLCGRTRPIHFEGVATVVIKLLNIVAPDYAFFGEKDWQQLAVIRRMVDDLNVPVTVVGVPTVRETSGLALSSRNQYLSSEERGLAANLSRALRLGLSRYEAGERSRDAIRDAIRRELQEHGLEPEYVELVDPDTLDTAPQVLDRPAVAALAVRIGRARLIDNLMLGQN
jgi:pantoate--beta-alanine ligase